MKERGGGVALMHIYVLEHIVSLCYRTAWWMFTKLGRDEVLMAPHLWLDFSANPAQGWIQGGVKIGHGGVPFFKKLLLQTGRLQQQTQCIAMI